MTTIFLVIISNEHQGFAWKKWHLDILYFACNFFCEVIYQAITNEAPFCVQQGKRIYCGIPNE